MIVIGLTGGIASGKSFVAGLLAERGAVVLDADQHAHAVLAEAPVREALVRRWGEAILDESGSLQRGAIAQRVFGEDEAAVAERRFLEGLVHPRVRERLDAELRAARERGAPAAVLDIPLLLEAGWADQCDAVFYVDTPLVVRQQRAAKRGWSPEELARRESAQLSQSEKKSRADAIIPGDNAEASRRAIAQEWQSRAPDQKPDPPVC